MAEARYVIFVGEVMHTAPLADAEFRYLTTHIAPNLRPLSDEEYMHGPAVFLHTFARYSYILFRGDVYWCAEWQPGLVVVRFSSDGQFAWAALRSPIPNFGGREATEENVSNDDEDADNPQYNLVFTAWDAQLDADDRESCSFRPALAEDAATYRAALAYAEKIGDALQARYSGNDKLSGWLEQCKGNLRAWAGEGIRVASKGTSN